MQETVISVLKSIPKFQYDPAKGSFKGWLLQLTRRRIADQRRKQQREPGGFRRQNVRNDSEDDADVFEHIADPAADALEAIWEVEWEHNLRDAALDRLKSKVDSKQYQIFDLYVFKGWKVPEIVRVLGVNRGHVYLINHRLSKIFKDELELLRTKPV